MIRRKYGCGGVVAKKLRGAGERSVQSQVFPEFTLPFGFDVTNDVCQLYSIVTSDDSFGLDIHMHGIKKEAYLRLHRINWRAFTFSFGELWLGISRTSRSLVKRGSMHNPLSHTTPSRKSFEMRGSESPLLEFSCWSCPFAVLRAAICRGSGYVPGKYKNGRLARPILLFLLLFAVVPLALSSSALPESNPIEFSSCLPPDDMHISGGLGVSLLSTLAVASNITTYAVKEPPLTTDWTYKVGTNPWPEYPRPQMQRSEWQNLNGIWTYQNASSLNSTQAPPFGQTLQSEVLVPSCLESGLSGKLSITRSNGLKMLIA